MGLKFSGFAAVVGLLMAPIPFRSCPKADKYGVSNWPQHRLKYGRGSEKPAAHTQQKMLGILCTISKTSARVSSSFQTRENIWNHEAAGRVVLLFSSVWKPDETRSTSFWNDFSKETIQSYAVLSFSHFSLKCLVRVICCLQSAFIVFVSFCF